ncbi:vanw family protein [Sphingomonas sp. So64.6b]|uniref:VanW family protein n=1 Tax=Sphingomonas sp. So64.6b TaxID=2997354 RepID=UPI0016021C0B|nr:VanW family protein [Sphingomonas sp. So64.6b]QNA83086.1 vanw family protein [Sphingomonas sp. So64.6b]
MNERVASATAMPRTGVPTRASALVFSAKAMLLRGGRLLRDIALDSAPRRLARSVILRDAPVIASIRSPLWATAGGAKDHALNAGKIQNLRAALRGIDGIEVGAGEIFSFWRHVGRPTRRRGFVAGRELREGCMIATVGGGLCQLSNALYEAGLDAGLEIVERHAHTRIVPGSRAAEGRDATVFWNYLDLRLRAEQAFRIEARLTADTLELDIRSHAGPTQAPEIDAFAGFAAHDCLSCGQISCHRHNPDRARTAMTPIAWLVDAPSAEFAVLYRDEAGPDDLLLLPTRRFGAGAQGWPLIGCERTADLTALRRSAALRLRNSTTPIAALMLAADARIAAAHARNLSPAHTHLVIAQTLLPHLWRSGVLQGRRFEVLLDRLPMHVLQAMLDAAHARHPESPTLGDFRAPELFVAAETAALAAADRLITPHRAVAEHFPGRVDLLDWAPATPLPARRGGRVLLFAGPAVARKGVHATRDAITGLDIELLIERGAEEEPGFWRDLNVRRLGVAEKPPQLAAVVLPALVEHHPRTLLRALAAEVPVIATAACGLPVQPGLTLVEPDDPDQLRAALLDAL